MKVSKVKLIHFKRFEFFEMEIKNNLLSEISNQFLILGDNGTGKTTVLQAIALCLSRISSISRTENDFDWQGWVPGRYERWGTPIVELDVHFNEDEIDATREVADLWFKYHNKYADGKGRACQ